jgi:hypothetical protein
VPVWNKLGHLGASLIVLAILPDIASARIEEPQLNSAVAAIEKRICFENFWWGHAYNLGETAPVSLRSEDGKLYAWANDLQRLPRVKSTASFFVLTRNGASYAVDESYGYNVGLMVGTPAYEQQRSLVFSGPHELKQISIPKECRPSSFATDDLRLRPLVLNSLRQYIRQFEPSERRPRLHMLRVMLSDSDEALPEVLAYAPRWGKVYRIIVRPRLPGGPVSADAPFLVREVDSAERSRELISKLRRYGHEARLP